MEAPEKIPISALNHFIYCIRRCALVHIEQLWSENGYTSEGRVMHDRTDQPEVSCENGKKIVRALRVSSERLGIWGVCDVVEFIDGIPMPVEYKRGKPKTHRADEVQLCAQALCLEEMFNAEIGEAELFYGKPRRRTKVILDRELRTLTEEIIARCRALLNAGQTPAAVYERKKCQACSLLELCLPRMSQHKFDVKEYLTQNLNGLPE